MNSHSHTHPFLLCIACLALASATSARAAITASIEPASAYSADTQAMNQALGITTAYAIEDFENQALHPDFSVTIPGHPSFTTRCGAEVEDEKWDGDCALQNVDENLQDGRDVEFSIAGGALRFGIGLAHLEQATRIVVNGLEIVADVRSLSGWTSGGPNVRNGYLWISADGSDRIYTILFDGPDLSDSIFFDHAAWLACPPGPIHYWDFEAGVDDHVGGALGTNNGAQPCGVRFPGEAGTGYIFDGASYVETDYTLQLAPTDSITISIWVKLASTGATTRQSFYGLERTNSYELRMLHNTDGRIIASFRDDSGNPAIADVAGLNLTDDQWHHYVAVRDAQNGFVSLYIDGTLQGIGTDSGGPINISNPRTLDLGAHNNSTFGHDDRMIGLLDEFRVYNRVLTESEIRALAGLPECDCPGDLDGDCDVDVFDFAIFAPNFGLVCF